ncbi:MAG: alginate export family protein [Prosthecobacter sp.]|nr:alginate export family protein [Prosthecobacter sp.]
MRLFAAALPRFLLLGAIVTLAHAGEAPQPVILPPAPDPLQFTFQARLRGEIRNNVFDFNSATNAPTDDAWLLQRIRVGLEWQPLPWLHVTVQGQDAREFFSDRLNVPGLMGAEGDDAFDLRLASVEIGDPKHHSLKLGRQVLSYGDERLVGPLEWLNFSRTFDAVKLHYQEKDWWLDAFTSSIVTIQPSEFNQSNWLDANDTRNQFFSGLYFSSQIIPVQTTDLYLFHLHEEAAAGSTDFLTLGTRWKGDPAKLRGWDYTIEGAAQAGQAMGQDLRAYAAHLEAGYNWLKCAWKPRVGLEYSCASGDGNAADGQVHTFQQLFPTGHPPYGFMDTFAWQNMHNLVLHLAAQPHPKIKTAIDFHAFWLADTGDAWYRSNGVTRVRPITPAASNYAGSEIDVTIGSKLTKHLDVLLGYSHFFAGAYLDDTGASDDADFAYLMVTLNY